MTRKQKSDTSGRLGRRCSGFLLATPALARKLETSPAIRRERAIVCLVQVRGGQGKWPGVGSRAEKGDNESARCSERQREARRCKDHMVPIEEQVEGEKASILVGGVSGETVCMRLNAGVSGLWIRGG